MLRISRRVGDMAAIMGNHLSRGSLVHLDVPATHRNTHRYLANSGGGGCIAMPIGDHVVKRIYDGTHAGAIALADMRQVYAIRPESSQTKRDNQNLSPGIPHQQCISIWNRLFQCSIFLPNGIGKFCESCLLLPCSKYA